MTRNRFALLNLCLSLVLLVWMTAAGCSRPAPAPSPAPAKPPPAAPPAPAPAKPTPAPAKPSPAPAPVAKPALKVPSPVVSSALDVGSAGYVIAVAIADAMQKERGVTMRVVPVGTDVGRTSLLATGRAHVLFQGYGAYAAQEGVQGFDSQDLGPPSLSAS